ncbi:MAG: hypothetical protein KH366_02740 [Clostridiaceae bacterium]|nr:hypothetical protein [Clostridiaceae bacterium]
MKLLVINPNTSDAMTEDIRQTVERVKSADTKAQVTCPDFGPESLESFYDYTLSGFGIIRLLDNCEEDYDGIMIACYGDPGLYAAKEMCRCPVIGIAETSIAVSTLLGSRFAILAASQKAVPMMENMVSQYEMKGRFAGVFPLDMSVLDVEQNRNQTIERLIAEGKKAAEAGADVLILGCAGMTGLKEPVSQALQIPVLDPVEITFLTLEMMCRGKMKTSKKGLYKSPEKKAIKNEKLIKEGKEA